MATRCQVEIVPTGNALDRGIRPEDVNRLYHHWDGYPTNMLPNIRDAFTKAVAYLKENSEPGGGARQIIHCLSDPAKSAAFLCHHEPDGYEPEDHDAVHGDAEFFYRITPERNDSDEDPIRWGVEVRRDTHDGEVLLAASDMRDITDEQCKQAESARYDG